MFSHQEFSRLLKIELNHYLSGEKVHIDAISTYIEQLRDVNLQEIVDDSSKKAFWLNIYNALTNYFIIHYKVKESVLEINGFFRKLTVQIGPFAFSLDDIEHGILRMNGTRRNNKPLQFLEDDPKKHLMVRSLDGRIHFALNCGSVSCPPIAFYSTDHINRELDIATESFEHTEFIVDHTKKTIDCSSIFSWYQDDFGEKYLNDPIYRGYEVSLREYHWTLH